METVFSILIPPNLPLGPIFIIVAVVVIFYLYTQHRQKMELIKKGESLVNIDSLEQMKYNHLSKGILTAALGLGVFVGFLLDNSTSIDSWIAYGSMALLFYGIGSLVFYNMIKNR
ncbi:MAG TPA: hypothetical protein DCE41_31055 [Cytophagales bacterium]|nr:hypothetical protein [Cytophagales bacterium]HAA22685.1 hypothetical protein [Cytophagales bacterium]HAP65082.1 hypothetical protein [Cytophagales bacterium]